MFKKKTLVMSCNTGQYRFVAAMAPRGGLFGAAPPAHDALVFGAERLLGQVLVALCAAETLFVPVATLVVQLLMARGRGERCNQATVN